MAINSSLAITSLALMAAGWWQVWRAHDELVTRDCTASHATRKYAGFLALAYGFLVQLRTSMLAVGTGGGRSAGKLTAATDAEPQRGTA